ncbi:MAG TPA: hypothetical protein VGK39_02430, partial [Cyclobacteriaceae bacterium]
LASSVLRILEASGALPEKVEDARAFTRQITGFITRKPVDAHASEKEKRSILQLAYASRIDSFAKLVEAVSTEPLYQGNEEYLSVEGLKSKLALLNKLNQQVTDAHIAWSNARINRNYTLYQSTQSVYKVMQAVRKYLRAIFGLDSEQYAQVKALKFIKPGRIR